MPGLKGIDHRLVLVVSPIIILTHGAVDEFYFIFISIFLQ